MKKQIISLIADLIRLASILSGFFSLFLLTGEAESIAQQFMLYIISFAVLVISIWTCNLAENAKHYLLNKESNRDSERRAYEYQQWKNRKFAKDFNRN